MVSTRSSTVAPATGSSTSDFLAATPAQQQQSQSSFILPPAREANDQLNAQPDVNLAALLVQQSQILQRMEQRLANLEARNQLLYAPAAPVIITPAASSAATPTPPMQAPVTLAATSAMTPPSQTPVAPATTPAYTNDPCKRIKLEIPKFDGKNAESCIINFERYCRILKLKTDEDILLAMGIAMTGKATLWWYHMEPDVTTWQEAKETVTSVYGDLRKKKDCANKLKCFTQGSMTISEFFVEVQNLNTYAQLDVETLPTSWNPD